MGILVSGLFEPFFMTVSHMYLIWSSAVLSILKQYRLRKSLSKENISLLLDSKEFELSLSTLSCGGRTQQVVQSSSAHSVCLCSWMALGFVVDMDAMQAGVSVKTKTRANSRLKGSAHGYDEKKTNLVVFLPRHH